MSDPYRSWRAAVAASELALRLGARDVDAGWHFAEALCAGGYNPHDEPALTWLAAQAGLLSEV